MFKATKILIYMGLALIFLALASFIIWPYKKTMALVLALAGVTLLTAYIILNLSLLKQNFKRKSFLYSSNLFLIIILVIAILVLINFISVKKHYRFDFTEGKIHSLSEQSVKVLKNLKNEVKIKCFFSKAHLGRTKMENLMNIYAYHSNKINYEFIEPDKNPGLVKRYGISEEGTTIFEMGDKESRITSSSEEDITNTIIKVSREKKKVIYFLEGHGEASIEDGGERGYSLAKEELEKLGYEVKKLTLAVAGTFPEDFSLLVIPGPEKDIFPNELETIQHFLKDGGKVFLMTNPENSPVLISFLKQYGIKLANDLIIDPVYSYMSEYIPLVAEYEYHEITKDFQQRRIATILPLARSVDVVEDEPEGISAEILAKTSTYSWSERQIELLYQKEPIEPTYDEDKDKAGPIPVAAVVTVEVETGEEKEDKEAESEEIKEEEEMEPEKKEGRLAVFGDSDFASNAYYNLSANGNLFLNTVNWLTEESDLISIQPKTSSPRTIHLTPSQNRLILITALILPFIILFIGIIISARRK